MIFCVILPHISYIMTRTVSRRLREAGMTGLGDFVGVGYVGRLHNAARLHYATALAQLATCASVSEEESARTARLAVRELGALGMSSAAARYNRAVVLGEPCVSFAAERGSLGVRWTVCDGSNCGLSSCGEPSRQR